MSTYVLLHGAGSDSWLWHLVEPRLRELGHETIAPDLPVNDDAAGLKEYADVVVDAIGERSGVILVAQSMAGFTAPLVAERVPVDLLILLNAMIPLPGEVPGDWWSATGHGEAQRRFTVEQGRDPDAPFDPVELFLHDVPEDIGRESAAHVGPQSDTPFMRPWPLDAWPDVPTRCLAGADDRFFPPAFQRRVAAERLGIEADVLPGGHLVALSRPAELVERLEAYRLAALATS